MDRIHRKTVNARRHSFSTDPYAQFGSFKTPHPGSLCSPMVIKRGLTLAPILCIFRGLKYKKNIELCASMRQRLHPTLGMIGAAGLLVSLIFAHQIFDIIYLFLLFLIVTLYLQVPIRPLIGGVRRVWPLLVLTFALHLLVSGRGVVDFRHLFDFHIDRAVLGEAGIFTFRLILIVLVGTVMAYLYNSLELARQVGVWFRKLPFGRRTAAQTELLIMLSLRFVPFLEQESHRLRMALEARGEIVGSRLLARARAWRRIMFPLIVNAFRRADQVSLAIQARGYDPDIRRTSLKSKPIPARQLAAALFFLVICCAIPWI